MKKRAFSAFAFLAVMAFAAGAFAWPSVYPVGTTVYKPDKAFNGYTLYSYMGVNGPMKAFYDTPSFMYLIDMSGKVVHTWKLPLPAMHGELLPNGNLICSGRDKVMDTPDRPGKCKYWMGGGTGWLFELDWDGNIVFQYRDQNMHHDFEKLPNGNYMYIGWEQVQKELQKKVRGGVIGTEHKGGVMWNDYLREITPDGKVVWEWHANAHMDPDIDIMGPIHHRNEWLHCNNVDLTANGDILIDGRHTDGMMIIDKKSGDIKWRWGNEAYLDKKTGRIEMHHFPDGENGVGHVTMGGPHDCNEIEPGLPGAGNIICFDNGMYADISRAVEVDPKTGKVAWESDGKSWSRIFYSNFISSAQRLPNGNTLLCSGGEGQFREYTRDHELVWEYIAPTPDNIIPMAGASVFRINRYGQDYAPQLKALGSAKGPAVIPPAINTLKVATGGVQEAGTATGADEEKQGEEEDGPKFKAY